MKSSTECLFEYGINTMNINDEFNTAMFYAMEMYAEEYHLNKISKPDSEEIERMAEEYAIGNDWRTAPLKEGFIAGCKAILEIK